MFTSMKIRSNDRLEAWHAPSVSHTSSFIIPPRRFAGKNRDGMFDYGVLLAVAVAVAVSVAVCVAVAVGVAVWVAVAVGGTAVVGGRLVKVAVGG